MAVLSKQSYFRLQDLPAELRLRIYGLVLKHAMTIKIRRTNYRAFTHEPSQRGFWPLGYQPSQNLELLAVCQQIRKEAIALYLSRVCLLFDSYVVPSLAITKHTPMHYKEQLTNIQVGLAKPGRWHDSTRSALRANWKDFPYQAFTALRSLTLNLARVGSDSIFNQTLPGLLIDTKDFDTQIAERVVAQAAEWEWFAELLSNESAQAQRIQATIITTKCDAVHHPTPEAWHYVRLLHSPVPHGGPQLT